MMPAARVTDMHTCPQVNPGAPPIVPGTPHVGGPVSGPGVPTVHINGIPAAVVGDMAMCAGPPDSIVKGSTTVMIGGKPAARVGDTTAHGGVIAHGSTTVMIGG
ncbi:MAG: PAAR domain-containing protein [bacterium]